jgi:hypothetical protein
MGFSNSLVFRVLCAIDVFVSSVVWPGQCITISARAGMEMRDKQNSMWWARWLSRALNVLGKDHCQKAIAGDLERARAAIARLIGVLR